MIKPDSKLIIPIRTVIVDGHKFDKQEIYNVTQVLSPRFTAYFYINGRISGTKTFVELLDNNGTSFIAPQRLFTEASGTCMDCRFGCKKNKLKKCEFKE